MLLSLHWLQLRVMELGRRMQLGAKAKGWTLTHLAKVAKLPSRIYLYRIKGGDRAGLKYVPAVAKALGCTVEWLTFGTGPSPSWAQALPTKQRGPYSDAKAHLEAAVQSLTTEARRRGDDVDHALEALEQARRATDRL